MQLDNEHEVRVASPAPRVQRLAFDGEIDKAREHEVVAAIDAALEPNITLEVDLSAVTFIDSSGVRALIIGHRAAAEINSQVIVFDPSPPCRKLLELVGLTELFGIRSKP